MQSHLCEAIALGEFSSWARQLLNEWQSEDLIRLTFESSVASFCNRNPLPKNAHVVILENTPSSRAGISLLRASAHQCILIWMGRSFTKEDLVYALENKVFGLMENPTDFDKKIQGLFTEAAEMRAGKNQVDHLLNSVKGLLIQTDSKSLAPETVSEMRVGVNKIDKLLHAHPHSDSSIIPLAQSQGLGDVLLTLGELERTGTLWIRGAHPHEEGKIDFLQGKITYAETGAVKMLKAIYRMFCWDTPRFLFNRKDPDANDKGQLISLEMQELAEEGEKHAQRLEKIRKQLPSFELKLDFISQTLNTATKLSPIEFHTLVQIVEYHYVGDILDYSDRWDIDLYEGLISLKKSGLIKVMPAAAKAV